MTAVAFCPATSPSNISTADRKCFSRRPACDSDILGGANRRFTAHHLLDKAGLGFQRLPHVLVKGTFSDITEDLNLLVCIALAQYPPFPLFNIARTPGRIQVVKCHETSLDIFAPAPIFSVEPSRMRNSTGIHTIEKDLLGRVSFRIMNECNLGAWEHQPG